MNWTTPEGMLPAGVTVVNMLRLERNSLRESSLLVLTFETAGRRATVEVEEPSRYHSDADRVRSTVERLLRAVLEVLASWEAEDPAGRPTPTPPHTP